MYGFIAVGVILAVLGGCIAIAIRAAKAEAIAEDDLEEEKAKAKHTDELMEKIDNAYLNRPATRRDALNRL